MPHPTNIQTGYYALLYAINHGIDNADEAFTAYHQEQQ